MESALPGRLVGWDIHGFRTMEDLDIGKIMEEAKERWLRPNEIHAILCNNKCFSINVRPVNLPKSGRIVLFDRKMLRNFRKDGHNWKKKKDGKTVKEAHEHLKVGDEERIHVYYAHGEDNPTFVRRCYWLLDKKLEHTVLVHYRETQEVQSSPVTPGNSNSSGAHSDPSSSLLLSEEYDSAVDQAYYPGKKPYSDLDDSLTLKNHEMRLHEINTLEWDELLVPDDANKLVAPQDGKMTSFEQKNQHESHGSGNYLSVNSIHMENALLGKFSEESSRSDSINVLDGVSFQTVGDQPNSSIQRKDSEYATVGAGDALGSLAKDSLRTQGSFGQWINDIMADSPGSIDDPTLGSSVSSGHKSLPSCIIDQYQSSVQEQIFSITEVSPSWAFSTEETKILIIGYFNDVHCDSAKNNLFCVCGDVCVPTEIVHSGVLRCLVPPCSPGFTDLYISIDGQKHISQIVKFEFRPPLMNNWMVSLEDKPNWEEFQVQMRLAHLLFSASKMLNIVSSKVSQNLLKKAKAFVHKTSHIADSWTAQVKLVEENKTSLSQAKDMLFELALQNRLYGWLLEKMVEGCKITDRDKQGQGVIHLCAILGYTWSVYPFSLSGLSLDYRDKFGWTALHWAAYYGREKMVAQLLSAGAKPNLVTDPSPENPGGCTAADLASKNGFDGLAAYLAEKALVQQFNDMSIAGNASGSLQTSAADPVDVQNISEEELYLKDSLAAYRTAADAAARIHSAFREHSFKLRSKAVQFSNPEDEARNIVAAMKIQHAFHNYETRKKMAAAARIQYRFRTWKIRKEFLNMRHQTIKIQAIFRGHQVRKQYQKIVWSVGVLEKAILRWRLKRKGFRGLQVHPDEAVKDQNEESVEHFFQVGRKQAEERNERAVIKVQALFRSKRAQEQYRRMKNEHDNAKLEFEGILNPDVEMGL